ncbi:hypothetical protein LTR78_010773 [Recurvomyces mirabilis]|uniref:Uncharacterized protein n=1 Tax=Recurvomyces mirabilis TaxID=574656 RepID=A0AAE0TMD3_9PEZI|nr:hypothetical protein LTR78_010773 [Recurvomyces mirabilis]KAK5162351.1 hypothetical protein LTS14_000698 [Recurvomyces mirabilis]
MYQDSMHIVEYKEIQDRLAITMLFREMRQEALPMFYGTWHFAIQVDALCARVPEHDSANFLKKQDSMILRKVNLLDKWLSGRGRRRTRRLITVTLNLGYAMFTEPSDQWQNFTDLWQIFQRHAHRHGLSGLGNIHFRSAMHCRVSLVESQDRGVTIHYEGPIAIGVARGRRLWFSRAYGVLNRLRRGEDYDEILNRCTQAFQADIDRKHPIELWFQRIADVLFPEQQQQAA